MSKKNRGKKKPQKKKSKGKKKFWFDKIDFKKVYEYVFFISLLFEIIVEVFHFIKNWF